MAQKDDATLLTQAGVIKAETTANANTATRVGTMMEDIIDSKMNNDDLIDEDDMSTNSATRVPSQQSVKAYVDAEVAGAGGGAVDSVNGATGVVVLDAGDIDFTPAGNIASTDVQAALVELDSETVRGRGMVAATGAVISFAVPQYYGSAAAITGNITFSTTGAVLGMEQVMRHNDSAEPSFPSEFKRMEGSRAYVTGVDNYIYLKYLSATKIHYTINQEQ